MRVDALLIPRWLALFPAFLIVAVAAVPSVCAAQAAEVLEQEVRIEALGGVFHVGERVRVTVEARSEAVAWRLVDGWGVQRAGGTHRVDRGKVVLDLPELPVGWYDLSVRASGEEIGQQVAATRFMVVTPFDLSKVERSPFGVMTHFAQPWEPDLIEPLARAGIKHVRDEIYWNSIERERGVFAFPEKFETYMRELKRHHMMPLTPMTFGNENYWDVEGVPIWAAAPYTAEQFEGYSRYCQQVLRHYGDQIQAVEIWNEYNGGFARGPADGRPEVYRQMLKVAYNAIKQERPDVKVLAGGTIGVPIDWLEQVFQDDGIRHMDGVSVHPYGYEHAPEQLVPLLEALRDLIRRCNDGKDLPIWVTEQGWYLIPPGERGNRDPITEHTKARYLVRSWVMFLANGVEKSFWYLGRNDQSFGTMGLVGKPDDPAGRYAPLPALTAYAILVRELNGATFVGQDPTPSDDIYAYQFRVGDGGSAQPIRVLWTTRGRLVDVALEPDGAVEVVDLMGGRATVHPVDGRVLLGLSDAPLYVRGDVGRLVELDEPIVAVPSEAARGQSMVIGVDAPAFAGREKVRVIAGVQQADLTGGKAELSLPVAGDGPEHWTPLELRAGDAVVYRAFAKTMVRPPVSIDPFPRMVSADRMQVRIRRASPEAPALGDVQITIGDFTTTLAVETSELIELAIPPLEPFSIQPVKISADAESGDTLSIESAVSFNPVPRRTITIDGDLTDWNGVAGIHLDDAPYRKLSADRRGSDDLGGSVRLAWDDQYLYVAAAVTDDVFDQTHHGYNTWKGDNIQLGISAMMPWTDGEWPQRWHEIGLALTPSGLEAFRSNGPRGSGRIREGQIVVRRERQVTIYECALPWSELGEEMRDQRGLAFGIYVNDADGAGRKGYAQWADIKRLDRMQAVRLVGE